MIELLYWKDALAELPRSARVVVRHGNGDTLAEILSVCWDQELVAVPLQPRSTDAEVAEISGRVSASLLLDESEAGPVATVLTGEVEHPDAPGLALIMFTSGSTGQPKGVMLSREAVLGNARKTAELHGFSAERPHGSCLPLYHCNALVMSLLGTRVTGTPLVLQDRFDPAGYFNALSEQGARTASIVPALLERLIEVKPEWPEGLEYLITAAAPLTSDLARRFHDCYGPRLRQGYGLTETVNFSFLMPELDSAEFLAQYVDQHPPVGLPLPGTELRLADGEVWIKSPDLMDGYWNDRPATDGVLDADGWLHTGDLGELRDGYLVLKGRRKELINRGGEKYYPLDLEKRWRDAGVRGQIAAVPVAEPTLGHELGLVVESEDIAALRPLFLSGAPLPAVVQAGGLTTTATGKPRRALMGERLAAKRDSSDRYEDLLDYAVRAGQAILAGPHKPSSAQSLHMHNQITALVAAHQPSGRPSSLVRTAVHESFDALVDFWPTLADGSGNGEDMMHQHRGLWKRLMTEWPLVSYAEAMAEVLQAGGFLKGRVLELGSGVGNTTSLIHSLVDGEFIWSDRVLDLVDRGQWSGRGVVFDLDSEPAEELGKFDTILATNVVHCVADKDATLRVLASMLKDGGRLILSEGASPTTPQGTPWALDYLCSLWGGWWDRGGFRSRWEWLAMFESVGLRERGFSAMRAGRHDLGGVVWGAK